MATIRYETTTTKEELPEYVLDDNGATFLPATPQVTEYRTRSSSNYRGGSGGGGGGSGSVLDYLARELHRYREAVSRMGRDILTLTEEVRILDAENDALRRDRGMNDRGRLVDGNEDVMVEYVVDGSRDGDREIVLELEETKSRVNKLQNLLDMRGEVEEVLVLRDEGVYDQLQEESNRVRKLEEACRRQEEVITEMERHLNKRIESSGGGNGGGRDSAQQLLIEENRRLREELKRQSEDSRRYYNEYSDYLNRYWSATQLRDKPEIIYRDSPRVAESSVRSDEILLPSLTSRYT